MKIEKQIVAKEEGQKEAKEEGKDEKEEGKEAKEEGKEAKEEDICMRSISIGDFITGD